MIVGQARRQTTQSDCPPHLFITFEGTEGSGKTTQMRLLVDRLRANGVSVVENQEPGSTAIGAQIRRMFLDPIYGEMAPMTELLLMFASRAQAAEEIIRPALARGAVVVSDRFTDSTLAYQGEARGLGFEAVRKLHQLALGSLWPDLTICLAIDLQAGLVRAHDRNLSAGNTTSETRIDRQPLEFHQKVNDGYRKIAALEPERFRIVDASGDASTVAQRVWTEVEPLLSLLNE
jgi:dTMP kinase